MEEPLADDEPAFVARLISIPDKQGGRKMANEDR